MPSYVPRELEPYQKREILEKREQQLMQALRTGAGTQKVSLAAERVRAAQLALLKSKYDVTEYQPETEQKAHQLANIEREKAKWASISTEEIASLYDLHLA